MGMARQQATREAFYNYYSSKLDENGPVAQKIEGLQDDRELAHVFEDIKTNGPGAAANYVENSALMMKISKKMGGVPSELKPQLKSLSNTPMSFHDACKMGSMKAVEDYVKNPPEGIDEQDFRGVTPLGY